MANMFWADDISGTTNALDQIATANLADGDIALVIDHAASMTSTWYFDGDSTQATAGRYQRPADYSSAGVWVLTDLKVNGVRVHDNVIDNLATSINELSIDGTLAGDSDSVVPTEKAIKTYVSTLAGTALTGPYAQGFYKRPIFTYKDADEIYISGGGIWQTRYSDNLVFTNSQLTFQLGSGGSNAGSDDLDDAANIIHYLYLDDSEIGSAGGSALVAGDFYNSITAPTWSVINQGWYNILDGDGNGTDRCVGAILVDATDSVRQFVHNGSALYMWNSFLTMYSGADSNVEQTYDVLSPCDERGKAYLQFDSVGGNADTYYVARGADSSRVVGYSSAAANENIYPSSSFFLAPDSAGQITSAWAAVTTATARMRQNGYMLPEGM